MLYRRFIVLCLTGFLTWSPLLACLPTPSMTPAEMDCCKKMAGHCDMGGGNHKCCDTTVNHAAPSKAIVRHLDSHVPALSTSPVQRVNALLPRSTTELVFYPVAPSPSPPGFASVLRI